MDHSCVYNQCILVYELIIVSGVLDGLVVTGWIPSDWLEWGYA